MCRCNRGERGQEAGATGAEEKNRSDSTLNPGDVCVGALRPEASGVVISTSAVIVRLSSSRDPSFLHLSWTPREIFVCCCWLYIPPESLAAMAHEASRPLLDGQDRSPSPERATHAEESRRSFELSSESTPLLHRRDDDLVAYGTERRPSVTSEPEDGLPKRRNRVRWPTIIALALLTAGVLTILVFAFAAPAVVREYAQEAAVFKPTALSIDSTTQDGVRARVQGDFVMDAGRVKSKSMRNFGRFATWIAKEVETRQSDVEVYLPEYGNVLVGNAALPSVKVNVRNGHRNQLDFLTHLTAGDIKGIHAVAMDWLEGRLGRLSIKAKATLHLKTGLISLGTQVMTDTITFEGQHSSSILF